MLPTDDPLYRIAKQDALYPRFLELACDLVLNCLKRDAFYCATSGLRTPEEQDKLYAIGRTTGAPGHIVTNATGAQMTSPHCFGIACDFARDVNYPNKSGLNPDYKRKQYLILAEEAIKLKLEPGYYWKSPVDEPHVQLPVKSKGITWARLRQEYHAGGYPAVFKYLDKFNW